MRQFPLALLWLLAAAALSAAVPAAAAPGAKPAATAPAPITAAQYAPDARECAMLAKINAYRKARGRAPLALSRTLGAAAEHHSRQMASKDYFGHTLSGGVTWSRNITNHGYPTGTARAENIAAGHADAAATFAQWKNSSGHRANMLNGTYKAIGIGRAYGGSSTYGWYWTTTFGSAKSGTIAC
jgi:uncharacterized protein YkwD